MCDAGDLEQTGQGSRVGKDIPAGYEQDPLAGQQGHGPGRRWCRPAWYA
ncbi:hypothetical protein ACU635_37445 [[Actinomadura] parvosata]